MFSRVLNSFNPATLTSALKGAISFVNSIIELKSVEDVLPVHFKQLRTYLKLMNLNQGWLINFGEADFADGIYPVWNKTIQTK